MTRACVRTGAAALLLLVGLLVLLPTSIGGRTAYVTTHGISMAPRFHTGDLAVLRRTDTYRVGDVAAYRSPLLRTVVMHRIVAIDESGHFTFKGDNNRWLDSERPTQDRLIGTLRLRIPHGGTWLQHLTSAPALSGLIFLLLVGATTRQLPSRRRPARRRRSLSRHAARASRRAPSSSPTLRAAAGLAVVGIAGAALTFVAWSSPATAVVPTPHTVNRSVTFSYTATVQRTPAYDGTTVTSPEPVFRNLTHLVDIHYDLNARATGSTADVTMTTDGGWTSTLRLPALVHTRGAHTAGTVRLDLDALAHRAAAAARVTGLPADRIQLVVTPNLVVAGRPTAAVSLTLTLTRLALRPAGDATNLTVTTPVTITQDASAAQALTVAGRQVPVRLARIAGILLLGISTVALLVLSTAARLLPGGPAAQIRRRYGQLLVQVEPVPAPSDRPYVDVRSITTLVRIAQRHNAMILHWSRAGLDTFIVQDDALTFRHRLGELTPPVEQQRQSTTPDRGSSHLSAAAATSGTPGRLES